MVKEPMSVRSFKTSFAQMFEPGTTGGPAIASIEIPLIQRDYAQGRISPTVETIRSSFLDVLHSALTGGDPVGLDFIYGAVDGDVLRPLDGQQRLTTLFLLHWYLAARTGHPAATAPWRKLSYATRPSARTFCERLVQFRDLESTATPSAAIRDQPWYLHTWKHDPTVQSMLVMIDAIHARFADCDAEAAWSRLVSKQTPAISFDLLPIAEMGAPETLYIRMNSRGRPLTAFERFKAEFEKLLEGSPRASEIASKFDGAWADLLWPLRGDDGAIDDEFLRYIDYITGLLAWRAGDRTADRDTLLNRCFRTYAPDTEQADDRLAFLCDAFDTWVDEDVPTFFASFAIAERSEDPGKVLIFGRDANANLLEACCHHHGNDVRFGNPRKLLLLAALVHRLDQTDDFARRFRMVRNLIAASEDELRPASLPAIAADVEVLIRSGDLESVQALNQKQRQDEFDKVAFRVDHPELAHHLDRLEDHDLLRGSLIAFDLDQRSPDRAVAFERLFDGSVDLRLISGALLASGDYQRTIGANIVLGSPTKPERWRVILTGAGRGELLINAALGRLLDAINASADDIPTTLRAICDSYVADCDAKRHFDWRSYMVKYDVMRSGESGNFRSPADAMGYSLCMLERERMSGYYRDPYLHAVIEAGELAHHVQVEREGGPWFSGVVETERWLRLRGSHLGVRCISDGFEVDPPADPTLRAAFDELLTDGFPLVEHGGRLVLRIPQAQTDSGMIDTEDRVQRCADFLCAAAARGLGATE